MGFFGMSFFKSKHSHFSTPNYIPSIDYIEIKNGIFDELFITTNTGMEYSTTIPQEWDYDTVFHALFNGNLFAGNSDFSINTVSHLRVKRRKQGTFKWLTLFEIEIVKKEDFNFTILDKYVRGNTDYEYSIVPTLNGTEGNYNIATIKTEFEGIYLVDKEKIYHAVLNIDPIVPKRQKPSSVISPIDRKYPFVVDNGQLNYNAGSIKATFVEESLDGCSWKFDKAWEFREGLKDWWFNGKAKIFKHEDGRMYMVKAIGDIEEEEDGHWDNVKTTLNFVEVGNSESNEDLYNNGLIDAYVNGE